MKTISDFTIYCTEEQTRKALELGAPIQYASIKDIRLERYIYDGEEWYVFPTAEQMVGWLEEKFNLQFFTGLDIDDLFFFNIYDNDRLVLEPKSKPSRKEATLTAIDVALEYLTNKK